MAHPTSLSVTPGRLVNPGLAAAYRLDHDRGGQLNSQQSIIMEPVRPAHGGTCRQAPDTAEGHEPGKNAHSAEIRRAPPGCVDPTQPVTNEDSAHKANV
nr:hypothetical protein [Mycobacterium sp.]